MNCKYLKIRQKKYKRFLFCEKMNKEIEYKDCFCCEVKQYKPVKQINPVSKNKEKVSKETYNAVFNRDAGSCKICGSKVALHLHHIDGRGKGLTDNEKNCCMLCSNCHLEIVHKNNKYWKPKLKEMVGKEYE